MPNTRKKGVIILTSTGLSCDLVRQEVKTYLSLLPNKSVAIITTAADGKEHNKYSSLAASQFRELGFVTIDFIDLESEPSKGMREYGVIYVCGGNTFKLLKYAKEAHFRETVRNVLNRGGVYIGVSAGSIILAPTINAATLIDPDPNLAGVTDYTGLGIIDFEIHPHYEQGEEHDILRYEKETGCTVARISNSQALVVKGESKEFIG